MKIGWGTGMCCRRGVSSPFGSDPTSGAYVTAQWNFHDKTTADLSGGLLDETGNWTLAFHAEAAIDGDGYLYRNGTPDGSALASIASCNNDDFSILETVAGGAFGYGCCAILAKITTVITTNENFVQWDAASGATRWGWVYKFDGTKASEYGALVADGVGGWDTTMRDRLNDVPEDGTKFLGFLGARDLTGQDQTLIRWTDENANTNVYGQVTSATRTENAGGSATHTFRLSDRFHYKALRIGRDHPSDGESIIGAGVTGASNGFPALT